MKGCTHEQTHQEWVEESEEDFWGNRYDSGRWQTISKSFLEDLDLHRYQCTRCKEIFYYSGKAKDFFENGKKSEGIPGLDGKPYNWKK